MDLPTFRYHPDPLATGSIAHSEGICRCCEKARGFIYTGPVYSSEEDLDGAFCPWCIADGSAAERFSAEFVDPPGIGGYGDWEQVPATVLAEVSLRTPSFSGWQQEQWWTHCGDAAEFLGVAGAEELQHQWAGAIPAIRETMRYGFTDSADYLAALDRDHGPSAYVFRCRHCGQLGGYTDHP
jgi:uncharacterized protein CbrC (UPF0167 family)